MPGSIQVSVLGLMDFVSPPPLSSLSLTVAMGRREYRTVGGGELSLPVVSLRENLIVMVHDAEGDEILRTEFKTMLLLERGLWYNLFPLKNGGSLHMKLQFLLGEEDRKRVREMRDSALKRRCMEKPITRLRRSFSDNEIGCSPARTIAETVTEGLPLDHSEPNDPIIEPYFGQREKFPASRIGMGGFPRRALIGGDASNLNLPQTMSKSFSVGMLSEITSQGKSKLVKESFLLQKETPKKFPAMNYETPRSKDLKCNEKIHKLDIGTELIKGKKNKSSDAKSGSYMTVDNRPETIGSGKSTRLAAGISSKRKDFVSVNAEKGPSIMPIIRNFETVREKGNLNLMQKGGGGLGSNAGTFKERPSPYGSAELVTLGSEHNIPGKKLNTRNITGEGNPTSSKEFDRKIDTVAVDENNNEEWIFRNKSLPSKKILDGFEKIEHSSQKGILGEGARTGDGKKLNARIMTGDENPTSSKEFVRKINTLAVDENNNEERNFRNKSLPLNKMLDDMEKIEHSSQLWTLGEVARTGDGKKLNTRNMAGDGNPTSSKEFDRKIDTVAVDENNNEERNFRNKSLPSNKMLDALEKTEHSCQQGTLGEVSRTGIDENMSESSSNEETARAEHSTDAEKHNSKILSAHRYATSSTETVDVNENNNEEQCLGEKNSLYQQGWSSVEVAKTVNDENTLEIHSNEPTASGSSYEQVEVLKSDHGSFCPIGILGTWTPRHLCITTGSKLLREFTESCTVSLETNPIESSSMREADTKRDGDASIQGKESKVLPSSGNSCMENSPSSSESNGGLIEQGVWAVILIAACGLFLKRI